MSRSKSSNRWLDEHHLDAYVRKAHAENYRSRAVYKLKELDQREKLLTRTTTVVELGAAPGGWTQYLAEVIGDNGRIIATDILDMDGFANVEFIQGDFTEIDVLEKIQNKLAGNKVELVLSDMAPNLTGVAVTDQARSMYLAELALDFARNFLSPDGVFVTKLFQGEGFDDYLAETRRCFQKATIRKPQASRDRSREVYAVARNLFL